MRLSESEKKQMICQPFIERDRHHAIALPRYAQRRAAKTGNNYLFTWKSGASMTAVKESMQRGYIKP